MYTYEMDPTRTEGVTERTRDVGRTDGRRDGRRDGRGEPIYPPPPPQTTLQGMDMFVHSWQICVTKMCISKGISYIRQMQRTYTKVLHEIIYPNVSKFFPCFFVFANNFRFTSYKYVTFEYPKVHRPTYLIEFLLMISRQTNHTFEYGMVS